MFRYLPEQASEVAPDVDWIHNWITDLSVFFTVAICGTMLYFAFRYRKRGAEDHETPRIEGNNLLEVIWTVVPTIISVWVAYYGIVIYNDMTEPKEGELILNATAKQWLWEFQYENGKKTVNEFVVPVGRPIKVVLTSTDVLHSFFLPEMRVKKDAIPGRFTSARFTPVQTGDFNLFCTEYCGTQHSGMLASLRVVPEGEYERWVNDRTDDLAKLSLSPKALGRQLYQEKACNSCHSLDGSRIVGPTFAGLWERERKFADGTTTLADEEYIRESILYPGKKVVEGYQAGLMPAYEGQLSTDEVSGLIAFIRSVSEAPVEPAPPQESAEEEAAKLARMEPLDRGKYIYENKLCNTCHSLDGSRLIGPSFKGLWMREGELQDGSTYIADAEYIKNSIWKPNDQIVAGYQPAMPGYEGQLSEEDVAGVVEFLKSLENG